jgi:hypothetical protein
MVFQGQTNFPFLVLNDHILPFTFLLQTGIFYLCLKALRGALKVFIVVMDCKVTRSVERVRLALLE